MSEPAAPDAFGVLSDPTTLTIRRVLPGPIDRVWAYLTQSDLRRQWLASGTMEMREGTPFTFVWRNDELTDPPGKRPPDTADEHRMDCRIVALDPPKKLVISWGAASEVTFELAARGDAVLLTLTHRRAPDRETLLNVSAGWHAHLDILVARTKGLEPEPFWDSWTRLRGEYERRLPA